MLQQDVGVLRDTDLWPAGVFIPGPGPSPGEGALIAADLLLDEVNAFAGHFTSLVPSKRIAVKASSAVTEYFANDFIGNTGTSPKQVYNNDGTLVWSLHNLLLRSQELDNASWTKTSSTITADAIAAPDNTLTADALNALGGAGGSYISQSYGAALVGEIYTWSAYVKNGTSGTGWLQFIIVSSTTYRSWFDLATGVAGSSAGSPLSYTITNAGNGWYRVTLTVVAAAGAFQCYIAASLGDGSTGVSVGTGLMLYAWGAQLNRGAVPTVYLPTTTAIRCGVALDHDPTTLEPKGLLYEGAATNLCINNSAFSSWPQLSFIVVTPDDILAPNGLMQADKICDDTGGGSASNIGAQSSAIAISAAVAYTFSIYVKAGTVSSINISTINDDLNRSGTFDLSTQTFTPVTGTPTGTFQALPNGWWRIAMTWTSGTDTGINIKVSIAGNVTRDGTHYFWAWGAQMETGPIATSPIPTFAASVARANDNYNFLLSTIPALGTEYSHYALFSTFNSNAVSSVFSVTDGTTNNYAGNRVMSASVRTYVQAANVNVAGANLGSYAVGAIVGVASRFKQDDFAGSLNGAAIVTDVLGGLPTVDRVVFGSNTGVTAGNVWYLKKMIIAMRGWSNAELVAKSALT